MKKIAKYLVVLFLVILCFNTNLDSASAYYACSSGESRCADSTLNYGTDVRVSTKNVYFSKGEEIVYQWENDYPGKFHVAFYLVSGSNKIGTTQYASDIGNQYATISAPSSGYYSLYALCAGGEDNRCQGGGRISP